MPLSGFNFASLRTRFMVLAVLLTLATSAVWGGWAWEREKRFLYQRLSSEGEMLVSSMAIPIINALLYEELGIIREGGLLDNFVADIMANRQLTPLYAMVLDQDGRVLAHSRFAEYGKIFADELTRSALESEGFLERPLFLEHKPARDLAMPLAIAGKRWGCLRVGIPLDALHRELTLLGGQIVLFAVLFTLGALGIFFLVGNGLARPLSALARQMEELDSNLALQLPESGRRDELGALQNSFSRMLKRLRTSERERDQSVRQLLENERLVTAGRIVAGVAHEINNPLAGIQSTLYTLKHKPESLEFYLPLLQDEVERIAGIVSQLLDLSRAEEIDRKPIDSRELTRSILTICRLAIKDKKTSLQLQELGTPTTLVCDAQKIQQVVLNLVLNAVDAMNGAGEVQISCGCVEKEFSLQLEDNGPGVPDHLKEQIFAPFFTTKAAGKGTGIGLAFCLNTIEKHGGSLRLLETKAGSGACFEIKLPIEDRNNHGA
jgi:signal transduction histidine kinase